MKEMALRYPVVVTDSALDMKGAEQNMKSKQIIFIYMCMIDAFDTLSKINRTC